MKYKKRILEMMEKELITLDNWTFSPMGNINVKLSNMSTSQIQDILYSTRSCLTTCINLMEIEETN